MADTQKPNRLDDLEAEWAHFGKDWERTRAEWKSLNKEQGQLREAFDREQERTRRELQRLWERCFLVVVFVALLLVVGLWR